MQRKNERKKEKPGKTKKMKKRAITSAPKIGLVEMAWAEGNCDTD